jgi:hypothetical protein
MIKLLRQPHGDRHDAAQAAAIVRARAADRIALAFCKPTGQRLRRKSACARAGSSRGWTARAKPAVRRWSAARRALIRILAGGVSPGQASRRSAPPNLGTVRGAADRRSAVDGGTKKPAAGIVDRAITPSARRGSSLGGGGADAEGRIRHLAAGTPLAARRTRQWPEAVRAITPPTTDPPANASRARAGFRVNASARRDFSPKRRLARSRVLSRPMVRITAGRRARLAKARPKTRDARRRCGESHTRDQPDSQKSQKSATPRRKSARAGLDFAPQAVFSPITPSWAACRGARARGRRDKPRRIA